MTDPTGAVFISYRHSQKEIAIELDERLRDHGVPIWRDEREIDANPLEAQIEEQLESDAISGAILLVSEDILESSTIVNVEIPGMQLRQESSEEFFVIILRCPGMSASHTQEILSDIPSVNDFSEWFLHELQREDEESPNFTRIISEVIQYRLDAITQKMDDVDTITCGINSYPPRDGAGQRSFNADLSHHFKDGLPSQDVWNNRIGDAVTRLTDQIASNAGSRTVEFTGHAHLPIAFTSGTRFPATGGVHAVWRQLDRQFEETMWDLTVNAEEADISTGHRLRNSGQTDMAVCISLTDDVEPEVGNTATLPKFNTIVEITRADYDPDITPGEGVEIGRVFQTKVREQLNRRSNIDTIHLFASVPVGLAFLLGQHTNTLPTIQTYMLDTSEEPRQYKPAITVNTP